MPSIRGPEDYEHCVLEILRAVGDNHVFGVPTFIAGGQAVFVRVMDRPRGDAERARTTIERILDLLTTWPELNEFKHTSIPR